MKNFLATPLLLLTFLSPIFANSSITLNFSFDWDPAPITFYSANGVTELWSFGGAVTSDIHPSLPYTIKEFPLSSYAKLNVEIIQVSFEKLDKKPSNDDEQLSSRLQFKTEVVKRRDGYFGKVTFVPIVKRGSQYEKVIELTIVVNETPTTEITFRSPENTENSILEDGDIYKIAIAEDGVYQLTYDFLKDQLAIDIDNINPKNIQLLGNGGGMLPTFIGAERPDDLLENRIIIVGEADNSFDPQDYILFYGKGPDTWSLDAVSGNFNMTRNIYDNNAYYFIKIGQENGKRIITQNSLPSTTNTTNAFDDYSRFEEDQSNLLHDWEKAQGSGQRWFGDHFEVLRSYEYNNLFSLPNLITEEPVNIQSQMALRALVASSFSLNINGQVLNSSVATDIDVLSGARDNIINYAALATIDEDITLINGDLSFLVSYPHPNGSGDGSEGWLDYIQVNARRSLSMTGSQLQFRDVNTMAFPSTTFRLSNISSDLQIWDITNHTSPRLQLTNPSGNSIEFGVNTNNQLKEFIAFKSSGSFKQAQAIGKIEHQNLHGIDNIDMVIVYESTFEAQAQELAQHRIDYSDLNVAIVRIDQLFNEFSSGALDPTAIRDFTKMLYTRNTRFKHLLLFGDGSFDPKDVYELGGNFIPVYENEDFNPISTFPADDYFAILNGTDANDPLVGDLDITVGRLTVNSVEQAQAVVNKIINYDLNPSTRGDWRNRLLFVGDDEDTNTHTDDADIIAEVITELYPDFNLEKIYLDAFPQISTPGGQRFPAATEAINQSIFKGTLAVTYLGHGGSKGWAQERVLNISDILNWENFEQLPLFITATCSFAGFDDAAFTTAGEEVLLNEKGGAFALLTTTRAVYANQNATLTQLTMERLFERPEGRVRTIGEAVQSAKNAITSENVRTNSRKFAIIGDPSQKLALPQYNVNTTTINGLSVSTGIPDTLSALEKVTIEGVVTSQTGAILEDFNGIIFPTIFDKKITASTLGQDPGSPVRSFTLQKNIIFKGRASVTNGRFEFTFVVPKDINYEYGAGKISYYATDNKVTDAAGSFEHIIIGGTFDGALADDQGPKVEVYMNTEEFVFGGITNNAPTLLVKLEDDNGINVVGNSIGHDLEGILDEDTQNSYLLNDFYESELDDHTKGAVRYPLSDLAEGRHGVRVKAWDVANNSSEGYTEFIVASSEEVALKNVLNYPNPFTESTCFQFDHNLANVALDIMVQVYTVSGKLVKTIQQSIISDGALRRDDCIEWNGKDDYGDALARGVYLYKVKVRSQNSSEINLSGESEFEKLVILK